MCGPIEVVIDSHPQESESRNLFNGGVLQVEVGYRWCTLTRDDHGFCFVGIQFEAVQMETISMSFWIAKWSIVEKNRLVIIDVICVQPDSSGVRNRQAGNWVHG